MFMETNDAAEGFGALAQAKRLDLMRMLASAGASGKSAGELASRLGSPASSLSFHLSALERAGLIQSTRQGRQIIYAVQFNGLWKLFSFLTETCCAGRPELCFDIKRLFPLESLEELTMTPAFNVLFLCTHNSARSIMAEAILTKIGGTKFNAYSAGSEPAAEPQPEVIDRLKTLGHDVSKLRSKSWTEFTGPNAPRMDFVITLCDTLDGQICPDFGDKPVTAGWPFPDPAKFTGSETERAMLLNETYGMIRRRLESFTSLPFASLDSMAMKARLDELADGNRHYSTKV